MKKSSVVFATVFFAVAASAFAQAQQPPKPGFQPPAPANGGNQAASRPPAVVSGAIPTKVAVIDLGRAIQSTKEGQKASADINQRYAPKMAEHEKMKQDLQQLNDQLNKGRATMSDAAQQKLQLDIQNKAKDLKRFEEDAQTAMDADDQRAGAELQNKMYQVIQQYAIQNGFAVVLNAGEQQSPVLWASAGTNITDDIVKLYDQVHPVKEAAAPAPPPTKK